MSQTSGSTAAASDAATLNTVKVVDDSAAEQRVTTRLLNKRIAEYQSALAIASGMALLVLLLLGLLTVVWYFSVRPSFQRLEALSANANALINATDPNDPVTQAAQSAVASLTAQLATATTAINTQLSSATATTQTLQEQFLVSSTLETSDLDIGGFTFTSPDANTANICFGGKPVLVFSSDPQTPAVKAELDASVISMYAVSATGCPEVLTLSGDAETTGGARGTNIHGVNKDDSAPRHVRWNTNGSNAKTNAVAFGSTINVITPQMAAPA
jgi:hypothetical protein